MFTALLHDQAPAALYLISQGACVDLPNYKGNTPLHIAAAKGMEQVVTALLAKSASCRASNIEGKYPYQLAATEAIRTKLTFEADTMETQD